MSLIYVGKSGGKKVFITSYCLKRLRQRNLSQKEVLHMLEHRHVAYPMDEDGRQKIRVKDQVVQQISIDPVGGCLYLQFNNEKVAKTLEHTDFINLDLDREGKLIGIEFVGVKQVKRGMKNIFIDLAKIYKRPELRNIPAELKRDLAVI